MMSCLSCLYMNERRPDLWANTEIRRQLSASFSMGRGLRHSLLPHCLTFPEKQQSNLHLSLGPVGPTLPFQTSVWVKVKCLTPGKSDLQKTWDCLMEGIYYPVFSTFLDKVLKSKNKTTHVVCELSGYLLTIPSPSSLFLKIACFQSSIRWPRCYCPRNKTEGRGRQKVFTAGFVPTHKNWNSVKNALYHKSAKLQWLCPAKSEQFQDKPDFDG